MTHKRPTPVRWSLAIYRALLILYPPAHRREYGSLMVQLFRDMCRDACTQNGARGLIPLWFRILVDLVVSATAVYWQMVKETVMNVNLSITPMGWRRVLLVVAPGILFGIGRISTPVWWLAVIGFLLVVILTGVTLVTDHHMPTWGLLVLGLLLNYGLLSVGFLVSEELQRMGIPRQTGDLLVSIPLWLAIGVLLWIYRRPASRSFWLLLAAVPLVIGAAVVLHFDALIITGLMLLPITLGLPLSRKHESRAVLFVIGAYSVWLFDTDWFIRPGLTLEAWYPVYVVFINWLFISIAPLLFLRAHSRHGQVVGLLSPIVIALVARFIVPWLTRPAFRSLRIGFWDLELSVFALLFMTLAFILYTQTTVRQSAANSTGVCQPVT